MVSNYTKIASVFAFVAALVVAIIIMNTRNVMTLEEVEDATKVLNDAFGVLPMVVPDAEMLENLKNAVKVAEKVNDANKENVEGMENAKEALTSAIKEAQSKLAKFERAQEKTRLQAVIDEASQKLNEVFTAWGEVDKKRSHSSTDLSAEALDAEFEKGKAHTDFISAKEKLIAAERDLAEFLNPSRRFRI